jgi:hypothetical protein
MRHGLGLPLLSISILGLLLVLVVGIQIALAPRMLRTWVNRALSMIGNSP